jgi:hypothetical protein
MENAIFEILALTRLPCNRCLKDRPFSYTKGRGIGDRWPIFIISCPPRERKKYDVLHRNEVRRHDDGLLFPNIRRIYFFQDMPKWKPTKGTRFLIEAPKSKGIFTYLKRHNNRS